MSTAEKAKNPRMCVDCGKRPRKPDSDLCGTCWFERYYRSTVHDDPDVQYWEWAFCEECGSWLGPVGYCRNTSCRASRVAGTDWY